jgi:hypothetical protein
MHWIEQLFGISPDRDAGLTELLIFVALGGGYLFVRYVRGRQARARDNAAGSE